MGLFSNMEFTEINGIYDDTKPIDPGVRNELYDDTKPFDPGVRNELYDDTKPFDQGVYKNPGRIKNRKCRLEHETHKSKIYRSRRGSLNSNWARVYFI